LQLSLIRVVVSVRFFDFGLGVGLARFGEVCKDLPHQHVVREVLGIAIVWVVLGRFVVARITRITRRVGVTFRITSRRSFIKDFSKESPTFSLTSPSYRIRVQAQVLTIFEGFRKATEVRYVLEGHNALGASSHGHNGSARYGVRVLKYC
jgi:hypothetical protein